MHFSNYKRKLVEVSSQLRFSRWSEKVVCCEKKKIKFPLCNYCLTINWFDIREDELARCIRSNLDCCIFCCRRDHVSVSRSMMPWTLSYRWNCIGAKERKHFHRTESAANWIFEYYWASNSRSYVSRTIGPKTWNKVPNNSFETNKLSRNQLTVTVSPTFRIISPCLLAPYQDSNASGDMAELIRPNTFNGMFEQFRDPEKVLCAEIYRLRSEFP